MKKIKEKDKMKILPVKSLMLRMGGSYDTFYGTAGSL